MRSTLPERKKFLEDALQGLVFWIGHRHSLFYDYPLTEGALIAEICNLRRTGPWGWYPLTERAKWALRAGTTCGANLYFPST